MFFDAFPRFLMTVEQRAAEDERKRKIAEIRMSQAIDWNPRMKWDRELNLTGKSYTEWLNRWSLFDIPGAPIGNVEAMLVRDPQSVVVSPCGQWAYTACILPAGCYISTVFGKQIGSVLFDDDVVIPRITKRGWMGDDQWNPKPFMSLTPMEIFTMRGGERRAKGNVVIGGLGMGYQLIQCSHRKKVKRLRVVELDQGLADWLFPIISNKTGLKAELIIGDAKKIIPTLEADVALVDIWPSYGGNHMPHCPRIGYTWCWGSQYCR